MSEAKLNVTFVDGKQLSYEGFDEYSDATTVPEELDWTDEDGNTIRRVFVRGFITAEYICSNEDKKVYEKTDKKKGWF